MSEIPRGGVAETEKSFLKTWLLMLLRVAVSGGLIAFLLSRISLSEVGTYFSQVAPAYLVISFVIIVAGIIVSSYKWQGLLSGQDISMSLGHLIPVYFIGMFFNNILPTTIGGDVVRTVRISRESGKISKVVVSIMMERATGLLALLCYVLAALCYVSLFLPDTGTATVAGTSLIAIGIPTTLALVLFFVNMTEQSAVPRSKVLRFFHLEKVTAPFWEALLVYGKQRRTLAMAIAISFLFQLMTILANYCVALSLGIHLPFVYFLLFIPIIVLTTMLPISISGIGVREGMSVVLWTGVGLTSAQAISMSFLTYLLLVTVGLIGGMVYVLRR